MDDDELEPEQARSMAGITLVPTPIGNLGDITLRAIDTLRIADHIVAEDTRRTRKLLSHLGLSARGLSRLDAHATDADLDRVVDWVLSGERVALVTDAGAPSVSDPGSGLVRRALRAAVTVTCLPGASAVTAAVGVSGLVDGPFFFAGFLPRGQADRAAAIDDLARRAEPCVLFEAPGRLARLLRELADAMPERRAVVARELTKVHEEIVRGALTDISSVEREWVGEITVVLGPAPEAGSITRTDREVDERIEAELAAGAHTRTVAARVAAWSGRSKRDVYERVVGRREGRDSIEAGQAAARQPGPHPASPPRRTRPPH